MGGSLAKARMHLSSPTLTSDLLNGASGRFPLAPLFSQPTERAAAVVRWLEFPTDDGRQLRWLHEWSDHQNECVILFDFLPP